MKKFFTIFVLGTAGLLGYSLRTGTYMLSGGNSKWEGSAYHGEVTIVPHGENFHVAWRIGTGQIQNGIGILYNDILSVAFLDQRSGIWGVGSFRLVREGELEGRWTTYNGTSQKPEYLVWKGY
jgi:hypothetical protein